MTSNEADKKIVMLLRALQKASGTRKASTIKQSNTVSLPSFYHRSEVWHNITLILDWVCPFSVLPWVFFPSCEARHTGMRVSALCSECVVNGPHVQACSH